jgi:hypothetical protein
MRRAVANAYAVSTLAQYEVRIDDTLAAFFRLVNGEERETNLGRWVHYCESQRTPFLTTCH